MTELTTKTAGRLINMAGEQLKDQASGWRGIPRAMAVALGIPVPGFEPTKEWWREYEIVSVTEGMVRHDDLMGFITTRTPRGLGQSPTVLFGALREAEQIADDPLDRKLAAAVLDRLAEHGITQTSMTGVVTREARDPRGGRPKKGSAALPLPKGSKSAARLAARLKRDHPEIAAAVERGEYKSMRQAAIAAGIVRPRATIPSDIPLEALAAQLRRRYKGADLERLIQLLQEDDAAP